MTLTTERQQALNDWLAQERRVSLYGPDVGDVSDERERIRLAMWLDKEIGDFLKWYQMQKPKDKLVLERTDYVNLNGLPPYTMAGSFEAMPTPAVLPPPAKGTHESDVIPASGTVNYGPGIDEGTGAGGYEEYLAAKEWSRS